MIRVLDLFCCEGGATRGYQLAGATVTGVDLDARPAYCGDAFIQGDAVQYALEHGHEYDFIHASPPCQLYSVTHKLHDADWRDDSNSVRDPWPDLVAPTREALELSGKPWVIENVVGARDRLISPIMLCGGMFGLRTYRHRLFESNWDAQAPPHPIHEAKQTKMGRRLQAGEYMHVVGNFTGVDDARTIMGMPWASRRGLAEAIPPAYAEWMLNQWLSTAA